MKRSTIYALSIIGLALIIGFAVFALKFPEIEETVIDGNSPPLLSPSTPVVERHDSDAFKVVEAMGVGWNLGNTLDSLDHQKRGINDTLKTMTAEQYYETSWGNPVTTEKMIADVAEMGFGAVRVPVTWQDHMDENFVITPAWLERVREVVDYVIDSGMYCIINLHHDVGSGTWPWLYADLERIDEYKEKLRTVWLQIAEYFQDYDEKLLFEGFNEILQADGSWSGGSPECYEAVNQLNQTFVDTVRATGGMNAQRYLVIAQYGASVRDAVLSHFRLPTDSAQDRLIASIHSYAPAQFTWTEKEITWTEVYSEWNEERFGGEVKDMLESARVNLVDKGIPVILSECGAWNKNNSADRCAYAEYLVREAAKNQIACFWWDTGGNRDLRVDEITNSTLYDRFNEKWFFPEVASAFVNAAKNAWAEMGIRS